MQKTKRIILLSLITTAVLFAIGGTQNASATYSPDGGLADKIIDYQLRACFNNAFNNEVTSADGKVIGEFISTNHDALLPNTMLNGSTKSSPKINCNEFVFGNQSTWAGLYSGDSHSVKALTDFDYKTNAAASGDMSGTYCFTATRTDNNYQSPGKIPFAFTAYPICVQVKQTNGKKIVNGVSKLDIGTHTGGYDITTTSPAFDVNTGKEISFAAKMFGRSLGGAVQQYCKNQFSDNACHTYMQIVYKKTANGADQYQTQFLPYGRKMINVGNTINIKTGMTWDELNKNAKAAIEAGNGSGATHYYDAWMKQGSTGGAPNQVKYKKGTYSNVEKKIFGKTYDISSSALSDAEVVTIYQAYLANTNYVTTACLEEDQKIDEQKGWYKLRLIAGGKVKDCFAREKKQQFYTAATLEKKGQNGSAHVNYFNLKDKTLKEIIDYLGQYDLKSLIGKVPDFTPAASTPIITTETDEDTGEPSVPSCYDGASDFGWLICPIMDSLSESIQKIYEVFIVKLLVLDAQLFSQDGDTYPIWQTFQGFANIVFIIFFLVIIFSQLTGLGIDNYGIKKILPKLVVAGILINLSFIICQLAIDIANIVGYGIGEIFDQIGSNVQSITLAETGAASSSGSGSALLLVALVAAISAGAIAIFGWSVIITVVLAMIVIVVAIIGLFVLLSLRKAFAVLLVAASPLAFACYMLPNTKKIFDRWLSAFKGVIIAFPVCNAMVYGGQAVAKIVVSAYSTSEDATIPFVVALSAAVICIIPVFFIPKVLKSSMKAVGKFTAGLQNSVTDRVQRRYNNGRQAEYLRSRAKQMQNRRSAGISMFTGKPKFTNRLGNAINDKLTGTDFGKTVFGGRARARNERIANARSRYIKTKYDNPDAWGLANTETFDDAKRDALAETMLSSRDFKNNTRDGNESVMEEQFNGLISKGKLTSGEEVQLLALAKALAKSRTGRQILIQSFRSGGASTQAFRIVGKEERVRSSLGESDRFVEQALADSGTDTGFTTFENWLTTTQTKDGEEKTNMQIIAESFGGDWEMYNQTDASLRNILDAKNENGAYVVSSETLREHLDNVNVEMGDKRAIVEQALASRGVNPTPTPNGQNNQNPNPTPNNQNGQNNQNPNPTPNNQNGQNNQNPNPTPNNPTPNGGQSRRPKTKVNRGSRKRSMDRARRRGGNPQPTPDAQNNPTPDAGPSNPTPDNNPAPNDSEIQIDH